LVEVDLNSDTLLVRADVAQAQIAKTAQMGSTTAAGSTGGGPTPGVEQTPSPILGRSGPPDEPASPPRPRRFYAKVTLDPNRPTPQVSNIAQSILAELHRVRGTRIILTLDIDAEAASGFPEDVENVVRDNARRLAAHRLQF
jgi:hypothetical protein